MIERTQSGLQRAKSEGKALGRPARLNEKQKRYALVDLAGGMSISALARKFDASRQTIMRVRDEVSALRSSHNLSKHPFPFRLYPAQQDSFFTSLSKV
ncbi:DNA invertase Pin-like site-specific DNA recombinase [Aminobacter aganoensis]|uniref:DNA invertase Pin-like site-specific DNA recombinase n=1 Tax=Aminobacter aganoensis TaxID=83264 RepID=A0A7X0FDG5_9HYPH|nr:DNA invertase Pin-like site-specific DNA recombinase [Aminobacter aganoensis]